MFPDQNSQRKGKKDIEWVANFEVKYHSINKTNQKSNYGHIEQEIIDIKRFPNQLFTTDIRD
ncbi:hypothetical protein GCM10011510_16120 [Streptococcus himalayensis]|uniref:Uncharacterized protein n=1 Tax=Streptococcus himalayensis TaxID=1888195 RepID=A0A917A964_9STRE|nr:hypothetical protein GCM10011510_16120 [Streptococcus himalayensis]